MAPTAHPADAFALGRSDTWSPLAAVLDELGCECALPFLAEVLGWGDAGHDGLLRDTLPGAA